MSGVQRRDHIAFYRARRATRGAAALALGVLCIYLIAVALNESRNAEEASLAAEAKSAENIALTHELKRQQEAAQAATVASLTDLLALVRAGEERAATEGRNPAITTEQAIKALERVFPPALVEEAARNSKGERGPPGPQGPPGTSAGATTTTTTISSTTTTATTRPNQHPTTTTTTRCIVNALGVIKVGC